MAATLVAFVDDADENDQYHEANDKYVEDHDAAEEEGCICGGWQCW